jgi:hypothetical protein
MIDFTTSGGIWWQEIGRHTITTTADTLSVTSLPTRKYMRVLIYQVASGSASGRIRFNNDSGNNYAYRAQDNGGAAVATTSTSYIDIVGDITTTQLLTLDIINVAGKEKLGIAQRDWDGGAGAGSAPFVTQNHFKWANTSNAISRIDYYNAGTGDYAAGTEMIVLGHD